MLVMKQVVGEGKGTVRREQLFEEAPLESFPTLEDFTATPRGVQL
jgi:hypothetical protein